MSHHSSAAPRILVADDARDIADIYCFLLSAAGYRTARAYDGLTALSLAKVTKPDLAILNNGMPGMNGLDVTRELRVCGVETKIVVTSACVDFNALAVRSVEAGADACVRQPCPPEKLLALLAAVLSPKTRGLRR